MGVENESAHQSSPRSFSAEGANPADSGTPLSGGMRLLERLARLVNDRGGSDIHLLEGEPSRVRIRGDLLPLDIKDHPVVTRQDIEDILEDFSQALAASQK